MSADRRYSDYDRFAWTYNRHWGNMFMGKLIPVMEKLLFPHILTGTHILDLCCGTGQLAKTLTERGYNVTGVDGSEEMICFARKNAPDAEFIVEDARYFKLPEAYNVVVSTFDSLNHIMSIEELTEVFCNVYNVLIDGGVFMFDMKIEKAYQSEWKSSFGIVEDDHVCVVQSSYSADEGIDKTEITIFRLLDGEWRRLDLTLLQKCYCEQEILLVLSDTGFVDIQPYDAERGLGDILKRPGRTFFFCRKPVITNNN